MSRIIFVSGEKQIGKTSELMRRFAHKGYAGGVLMPVQGGERYFYALRTKEVWKAEADSLAENRLLVGRFVFSETAFVQANEVIVSDVGKCPVLVIDEIGPLELQQQKGLYEALEYCLQHIGEIRFLILVVRPSLLETLKAFCELRIGNV